MFKRLISVSLLIVFSFLASISFCEAGFGIQPPYVRPSKAIFAGTHYEQKITLLRSSADVDMQAEIKVTSPEMGSWISIDKGDIFDLPIDQLKVSMVVRVDVPSDAAIGNYKGHLNIRISPKKKEGATGVAIALGARVEIDITVTDESLVDFIIRKVDILDMEEFKRPWNLPMFSWFFYRVKVDMKIENTGNTKIAPSKVHIDIYDNAKEKLLESHNDKSIEKIEPFDTKTVSATFPTKLGPGEYWGKISIYKDNDIIQKNDIIYKVFENGKAPTPLQLGKAPYLLMTAYIITFFIFIMILIKVKVWNHLWFIFMIVTWPLRMIFKMIRSILHKMKVRFWKSMHKKASRYTDVDKK